MKYALFDLPIESIHGQALRAALATRCAGDQGKYWEMRERLFDNPQTLDQVSAHAQAIGLDRAQFDACVGAGKYLGPIRRDMEQAQAAGISGTPSFLIAVDEGGRLKVRSILRGAQPFANFKAQIDAALAGQ